MRGALSLAAVCVPVLCAVTPEQLEFFEKSVRPLLAAHCYVCHGPQAKSPAAGLRLDTRAGVAAAVTPGDPKASRLIKAVRGQSAQRMPPAAALKEGEIAALEKWIADGVAWPEETPEVVSRGPSFDLEARRRGHWAWQPVRAVTLPHAPGIANPVDRLYRQAGAPAGALTLLRRLTFDLTGLPPSPDDIAAFAKDSSPAAYERAVDRLIASSQFGERLARRWMDLIRYSESHGSEGDPDVPQAWRYRDYLIRAFNGDVPYDQFIREHLAGDLLPNPRIDPGERTNESAIGAAHLRMVEHGFQPVDPWEDRVKWADNQIDVFSKAFQGLTISCARCHDHKFDAISQRDFYALFGIFAGARPTQVEIDAPGLLATNREALEAAREEIRRLLAAQWRQTAPAEAQVSHETMPARFRPAFDVREDYARWTRHGTGAPAQPSRPGEFFVASQGERILHGGIYPGGVYSHRLSTKHAAVVSSPRFKIDSNWIAFRAMGGNFANVQLIVENYAVPRGGIYNLRYSPKRDEMGWARWDARFWKGFTAYIELATYEDVTHFALDDEQNKMKPKPAPPKDGRSWFGLQQVYFHDEDAQPKSVSAPVAIDRIAPAIDAWEQGTATEEQAALLDWLVRRDLLPVSLQRAGPELRAAVERYRHLESQVSVARRAPGVVDDAGPDQALLVRGNHNNRGEVVPRRYLTALESKPYADPRLVRLNLAEEVASAANPLTARVMANRIWQWMFRRGIVRTADNFGKLGEPPSHPQLLDYLAGRFVQDGWSIRKMIRLLATSAAYRSSALATRRLEAEEIRDSILTASGQLDATMYGPPVDTYYMHDTGKTKGDKVKGPLDGLGRRSVYLEVRRNVTNPFLEAFDVPKPTSTRGERDVTTVPAQSLALMNSEFVIEQAAKWARQLPPGADARSRIDRIFLRTLGRPARSEELDRSQTFIDSLARQHGAGPMDAKVWRDFIHAVFNFKEFLYVR